MCVLCVDVGVCMPLHVCSCHRIMVLFFCPVWDRFSCYFPLWRANQLASEIFWEFFCLHNLFCCRCARVTNMCATMSNLTHAYTSSRHLNSGHDAHTEGEPSPSLQWLFWNLYRVIHSNECTLWNFLFNI